MDIGFDFGEQLQSDDGSFPELDELDDDCFGIDAPNYSTDRASSEFNDSSATIQAKAKTSAPWEEDSSTPSLRAKMKLSNEEELDHTVKLKESPKISEHSSTGSFASALMPTPRTRRTSKSRNKHQKVIDSNLCARAEDLLKEGLTPLEIKNKLGISQRAMKKLQAQYDLYGRLVPARATPNPQQAIQKQKEFQMVQQILKGLITKNCSITLKQMQKALREQEISKSRSTIHAYLARMRISRKKLQKVPLQRNSNNKLVYRQNYCRMIQQIPLSKQIFLDQTIFGLQTSGHYGWAPKGEQPKTFFPASRRKHITLLAAVSIRGFEATKIIKGPVTSKHVCQFLQHYLDHLQPDEILILDNARMHHAAVVKQKIKELKRPVRYMPAYTPQLNPIENIFSEIKGQYVKLKEDRELKGQDMVKMIEDAIKNMRSKEFSKYYQHYEQWLKKGVAGELFI